MDAIINGFKQKDNMDAKLISVTNIYLLFLKLDDDIKKSRDVPVEFKTKGLKESSKLYADRANVKIIRYTEEVYRRLSNTPAHIIIEKFEGFQLEQIIDRTFAILFLRSKDQLIFLNYINNYNPKDPKLESYIPINIPKIDTHRYSINQDDMEYYAINTYEPFLKYGQDNFKGINKDLNVPFFNSFALMFNFFKPQLEHINIGFNCFTGEKFKYFIIREYIIITEYSRKTERIYDENSMDQSKCEDYERLKRSMEIMDMGYQDGLK